MAVNFLEALNAPGVREGDQWIRPRSAFGSNFAYMRRDGDLFLVPTPRGGVLACLTVAEFNDQWNVVSPNAVLLSRQEE